MGYQTWFTGGLEFDKPVSEELKNYINEFSRIRHMVRDPQKIVEIFPNWEKYCFNGNLGANGEYFVGEHEINCLTNYSDTSVVNGNRPPKTQPGLWCQWVIEGNELVWDQGEKFYEYEEWLIYLIDNFIAPSGYKLNGEIQFQGEDEDDFGVICVVDNEVELKYGMRIMDLSEISTDDLVTELNNRGYFKNAISSPTLFIAVQN